MLFALLLTVTRASQGAFLVSSFVVTFVGASRKMFLILLAIALPAVLIGLYVLQQSRNVGFYDAKDGSITWRQTVYREGFNLAVNSPRHLLVGVGMDSIKRYAKDWHLFDDGRLPMGHFHSTPLQLAVERGLPALLIWFWILWLYGSSIWQKLKSDEISDWREKGILLGGLGSLVGFFTSGLVHYNLGDGEVAMVFYILMGLSIYLTKSRNR
jgi:putative inorganic carbon (hco3(-)) transporter